MSQLSDQLLNTARALPDYHLATPGYPEDQLLLPEKIIFYYRSRRETTQMFINDRFILFYLLSGCVKVEADQNDYLLTPGKMLLVFPGIPHRTKPVKGSENHLLQVAFNIPENSKSRLLSLKDVILSPDQQQRRLLLKMAEDFSANWGKGNQRCLTLPYRLGEFIELLRNRNTNLSEPKTLSGAPGKSSDNWKNEIIHRIANYCSSNLTRRISINELARELKYSPSNLRLLFRKFTGDSLGRYLRSRRLKQATALLRSSALNIKEIAERCGYDSIASFCRAYKRESGFTPQEIRKMISEHDN